SAYPLDSQGASHLVQPQPVAAEPRLLDIDRLIALQVRTQALAVAGNLPPHLAVLQFDLEAAIRNLGVACDAQVSYRFERCLRGLLALPYLARTYAVRRGRTDRCRVRFRCAGTGRGGRRRVATPGGV